MPFGKRLSLCALSTLAVDERSEQSCVIFFVYFMSLSAAATL